MNYMGNKDYWNKKFESKGDKPLSPEKSMIENIASFKKGSVLDIACGDGRNALFLVKNGFEVTGIDFSSNALERLKIFSQRDHCFINTKQIDLSVEDSLKDLELFDNILINHYRFNKNQLAYVENHITDNGILFVCGFGDKHEVDEKIREEDLIKPTDFEHINKSFNLIKYIETQDERGFFVTYIFQKKK